MRPTSTRGIVVVFAVTLAVLQYIDRVAISQAAPLVMKDLALTKEQMSWVFSAFTLAYALFEIPGGYLGDWIGPRKVLLRIVLWWSFFTAATGWAWSLTSLAITRFLFGAGEAGCFPNLSKALNRWMPAAERSRAQGIMWMSARWGGAITPLLVYGCLTMMTWRQAFLVFGLAGVAWAIVFACGIATTREPIRASTPPRPRSCRRRPREATTSTCPGAGWPPRAPCGACAASMPR